VVWIEWLNDVAASHLLNSRTAASIAIDRSARV
jgi:hypothetical protein